jgi:hypothetical protein
MTRLLALVWPELRALDADAAPWERMLEALDDLSPRVEEVAVGVALVDVTGLGPLWGPERRVAARAVALVRAVALLRVRCGVGGNRWLATLAARLARFERTDAPAAFHALEAEDLRDLPVDLLPADAAMRARLARFGLTAMGQLADLPRSAVGAQFGPTGERLQALARGRDPRPIVPRRRPERVARRATFESPLGGIGAVGLTLRRLAAEMCDELRARPLAPGRATLALAFEDAPPLRVTQAFPQPALEPDWIARLLLSRVEAAARGRRFPHRESTENGAGDDPLRRSSILAAGNSGRRIGPSVSVGFPGGKTEGADQDEPRIASVTLVLDRLADPAMTQLPAFEARAARWEELRWSLERIRHRFGDGRLWRATVDRPAAALSEHRSRLTDIGA